LLLNISRLVTHRHLGQSRQVNQRDVQYCRNVKTEPNISILTTSVMYVLNTLWQTM
jgi:hypothetical protein